MLGIASIVVLGLLAFAKGHVANYGQCGGEDWKGETTCVSGSICTLANEAYSQCVPAADSVQLSARAPYFYKGHDLSSLAMLEAAGYTYKDTSMSDEVRPLEDILYNGGMTTVRLRIWVNPVGGTYGLAYNIALAKRFYAKGRSIYLDFHFADSWADPSKQPPPAAWPTTLTPLASTLRSYVASTLESFHNAGVPLAFVSLGNEIRNGMLWPLGEVSPTGGASGFKNFATLWAAARAGVNDAVSAGVSKPQVMIHIDNGWDTTLQTEWFSALTGTGLVSTSDWDVFGWSFYPFYGTSATFSNLLNTMNTMGAKYGKPMHVVETDWPEACSGVALSDTAIPVSAAGQLEWMQQLISTVKSANNQLGQGVHYWEPGWLNNTGLGSSCSDAILFDGDWSNPSKPVGLSRTSVKFFLND